MIPLRVIVTRFKAAAAQALLLQWIFKRLSWRLRLQRVTTLNQCRLVLIRAWLLFLHPTQVAGLRAAVRTSSNYVTREDILAIYPALPTDGLVFGYYNCAIYSSVGVVQSGYSVNAGTGVSLNTGGAVLSSGNTHKGALFSINEACGFVMQRDPNIRMAEDVLIGSGGMNLVAGYVGEAARISEQ